MLLLRAYVGRVMVWGIIVVALGLMTWRPALRLFFTNPYADAVHRAATDNGLDPLLIVAVMRTESRFNPQAVSPKGARGLMQLMPDTAVWVAEQMGVGPISGDHVHEPILNITLGTWYLRFLLDSFDKQLVVAIAAYNAGPGNVRRWLDEGTWLGALATLEAIPFPETREYVRRVTDSYRIYRVLYPSPHGGHPELIEAR